MDRTSQQRLSQAMWGSDAAYDIGGNIAQSAVFGGGDGPDVQPSLERALQAIALMPSEIYGIQ